MASKKWIVGAIAASAAATTAAAGQRLVAQWRRNPDPLAGLPARFPDGESSVVVMADGARISVTSLGKGPTIVCVHGLTSDRHDWGPMAPALLASGYRLVAIEQRGHGESTEGSAGYGSAQLGRDLAEVFEKLDIEAVALMGHSMGGMASMAFAVDSPQIFNARVSNLVLIGTAASMIRAFSRFGLRVSSVPVPDLLKPAAKRLRVGTGLAIFGDKPSLHMIDEALRRVDDLPEDIRAEATAALSDHDVSERLGSVTCPALVIGGTKDKLILPSQVRALADELPDADLHMLRGAGHMLIWERHRAITDLISEFLRSSVTV